MPQSLRDQPVRTPANARRSDLDGLRAGKANLRIDANSVPVAERKRAFLARVREAMRRADLSQKAFALNADQSESVISEALNGARNLSADWLDAQPDAFIAELNDLTERERGITEASERQVRAERIAELVRLLVEVA